jgi:predicted transcriptional regulator
MKVDRRRKGPTSKQYTDAVGKQATTEQVAERLDISFTKALHNLNVLASMGIVERVSRDIWKTETGAPT